VGFVQVFSFNQLDKNNPEGRKNSFHLESKKKMAVYKEIKKKMYVVLPPLLYLLIAFLVVSPNFTHQNNYKSFFFFILVSHFIKIPPTASPF
jgi:hypothetical protein